MPSPCPILSCSYRRNNCRPEMAHFRTLFTFLVVKVKFGEVKNVSTLASPGLIPEKSFIQPHVQHHVLKSGVKARAGIAPGKHESNTFGQCLIKMRPALGMI